MKISHFEQLPSGSTIPTTAARLVSLHRSENIADISYNQQPMRIRAYLIMVFSLKGRYLSFVYLAPQGPGAAMLYSNPNEASVTDFMSYEKSALSWLETKGYKMLRQPLAELDSVERKQLLASLPFERSSADVTQDVAGIKIEADTFDTLLEQAPEQVIKDLRELIIHS